jgi:hypothetical protein
LVQLQLTTILKKCGSQQSSQRLHLVRFE